MIPRNHFNWLHKDHHSFSCLGCDHLARILVQGAGVAFPDRLAYALDGSGLVVDGSLSLYLDSPQLLVTFASFNKTGQPGIAPQVDCLLRPGISPENHFVVDKHIPHCYYMRPAIVIDGGHLEYTLLFKKG